MDQERHIQTIRDPDIKQLNPWAQAKDDSQIFYDGNVRQHSPFSEWVWPICLFFATVFTTLWAGAYGTNADLFVGPWRFLMENPGVLWKGVPFAATLLGILVTHEFGHYMLSKIHRIPASLPFFIPGPPHFIGTFGAIIRMRGPILSRKALFDIGVAGPIAGFLVALPAFMIGLSWSQIVPNVDTYGIRFGPSTLVRFFVWLFFGTIPFDHAIAFHPIADAAWFGLFVTSLNLIPIGQLDGGHVAYALWGNRQRSIALAVVPALLLLGFIGWPGWFLWAGMAGILGLAHPPVMDPETSLGPIRMWIGWAAIAIFALTFAPVPFSVH
jgi:membrane-associated protease RseP (regulator of RpoE activity)